MPFVLNLNVGGGAQAVTTVGQVTTGLTNAQRSAVQARNALGQFITAAQGAGAAGAQAGASTAKGMDEAAAASKRAKSAIDSHGDSLTRLIHLAEAYIAVHQVESVIDGYIEIRNKTQSVATSEANLNALMQEQFRIAQETRNQWEALASTYQRISNAARGLGMSQREIIDLTETLSKGLRLSGSNSFEATMTMMELTHAFTVGALTGREFRVMMKDAPALMHELQVVSGKTGAEFAEMGKHGKFTAQQLVEWFGKAKETINEKFAKSIPTISEGFQSIRNAAQKFFGDTGMGTGVIQGLTSALIGLGNNFETVGTIVLAVVEALLGLFIIEKIIVLVKALTLAIAANPLGAILTAITVGIALLRQFGDEIKTNQKIWANVEGQFVTVGDQLYAVWQLIKQLGVAVKEFVEESWAALTAAMDDGIDSKGIEFSMRNVLLFIGAFVDAAIGLFRFLGDSIVTIFGGIPSIIGEAFINLGKTIAHDIEVIVNVLIAGINKLIQAKNVVIGKDVKTENETTLRQWQDKVTREAIFLGKQPEDFGMPTSLSSGYTKDGQYVPEHKTTLQDMYASGGRLPIDSKTEDFGRAIGMPRPKYDSGLIDKVDLNFGNPFEGASVLFLKKFGEDWKKDVEGTTVVKDMVNDVMDKVDKIARDHAAKRVMDEKFREKGEISTEKGTPDAKLPNEKELHKAESAFRKLEGQLRSVTEASNPQSDAIEKLAHAHEILEKAVAAVNPHTHKHLLTIESATQIYENYRTRLQDALYPFDAWVRKQNEATEVLRDTAEAQERAARVQAFISELRQKTGGLGADPEQVTKAERIIEVAQRRNEIMRAEQAVTQTLIGPQHTYQIQLQALGDLLERGRITAEQYNRELERARSIYLAAETATRTFGELTEAAWLQAKESARQAGTAVEEYSRIVEETRLKQLGAGPEGRTFGGAMEAEWIKAKMAAEDFGATLATTIVNDIDKFNNALISAMSNGEVSFRQLIGSMLEELARLALKMLEIRALSALFSAFGGPSSGGPDNVALANVMAKAMGFSTGGSAMVGGTGGTDSQFVALRATPNERITVETPYQQRNNDAPAAPDMHVRVINELDPSIVHAAMESPAGERIILNTIRRNPGAARSYSGSNR